MAADELEDDADDVVVHLAQPLGATPALPVLQQQALRIGAAGGERVLQRLHDGAAQRLLVAAVLLREPIELGRERALVEQLEVVGGARFGGGQHAASG